MSDSLLTMLDYDEDSAEVRSAQEDAAEHMDTVEQLVSARLTAGLMQQDVARRMETTQSVVSSVERLGGDAKLTTLLRYARAVGARARISALDDSLVYDSH